MKSIDKHVSIFVITFAHWNAIMEMENYGHGANLERKICSKASLSGCFKISTNSKSSMSEPVEEISKTDVGIGIKATPNQEKKKSCKDWEKERKRNFKREYTTHVITKCGMETATMVRRFADGAIRDREIEKRKKRVGIILCGIESMCLQMNANDIHDRTSQFQQQQQQVNQQLQSSAIQLNQKTAKRSHYCMRT
ncbi:hypothetical protein RFI_31342 [Reticulomyxa filosa]|uniref:Uncharacterized protein n=1 Tax=Reticulomyxa filosa TaxID=46433 RepID=X6LY25_RETFI|nr:hypothetical protein RFI_31342 [Reticulomyxa filosa]|eukprot:ETO06052.1 hypothetical protein RFI_31342 [Reticulomyxa filosa]